MDHAQASTFINDLLRLMVSRSGSDLFLTVDFPPAIKVDGKVTRVSAQALTGQHTQALARSVMNQLRYSVLFNTYMMAVRDCGQESPKMQERMTLELV